MSEWTKNDIKLLEENYKILSMEDLSKLIGKSVPAIRGKKSRMGLVSGTSFRNGKEVKHRLFTEDDQLKLKNWYLNHEDELMLEDLSLEMGRTVEFLCRQARKQGLTNFGRKPLAMKKTLTERMLIYANNDELRNENLKKMNELNKANHPKGMLGKTHSKEFKEKMSKRTKKYFANITPEQAEQRYQKMINTKIKNGTTNSMKNCSNPYSRTKSGKRADLNNVFFRSAWEANMARYYNFVGIKWEFEPKTFIFEKIRRGCISYTPDFYLPEEDRWVEVKGWMDDKSKTKLKRFEKYFPEEFAKLELITQKEYKEIEKLKSLIPGWE